jgi:integrase
MPRRVDFKPVETVDGWMVSVPPKLTADGKRVRRFFPELREAQKFAGKLRTTHESGVRGGLISASLAMQAAAAVKVLEGSGLSLVEAARMAVATTLAGGGAEVFGLRYKRALLAGEAYWSDRYLNDVEKIPKWIGAAGMKKKCGELVPAVLDELLRAHGATALSTLQMRRARVLAVLNFKERHRKTAAISMMTLSECRALLRACEGREQVRAVALMLFAGIRPDAEQGEMSRLEWSAVGKDAIYVPPEISKTGTDRHVPLTPRLRRLLRGHPKSGPVCPSGWRRAWQRIRKDAGIADRQDVLRHMFASHFLAAYGEDAAKQAMGHTAKSSTLFRHYRRAVEKPAGLRFFGDKEKEKEKVPGLRVVHPAGPGANGEKN